MNALTIAQFAPNLVGLFDEVIAQVRALDGVAVVGEVTEQRIADAIGNERKQERELDLVIFGGHGSADGVQIAGAQILSVEAIAQYLSFAGAKVAVFSTCSADMFVERLQAFYPVTVIAPSRVLDDIAAWRTITILVRALADTGDIYAALRRASPGGASPYRLWPNPTTNLDVYVDMAGFDSQAEIKNLLQAVCTLDARVQVLAHQMYFALVGIAVCGIVIVLLWLHINGSLSEIRSWQSSYRSLPAYVPGERP